LQRNQPLSRPRLAPSDNQLLWVAVERSDNHQTLEEVVALVRPQISDRNRIRLVSRQMQRQLLEHSVLHQLSVRSLPLDNLLQEDLASPLPWELNQTHLDRQQRRQVPSDNSRHSAREEHSDSLPLHPKQVRSVKRDKPTKLSHRHSDKLHNKAEVGSARLQRLDNRQLLVSNRTVPLDSPLAWVSNLSQRLVSPQRLLNRIQHLVNPQSQVKIQHLVNPQSRVKTRHSVSQQQMYQRQLPHRRMVHLGSPRLRHSSRMLSASLHHLLKHKETSSSSRRHLHNPQPSQIRSDNQHSLRAIKPLVVALEQPPHHNKHNNSSSSKNRSSNNSNSHTQSLYLKATGSLGTPTGS
jgi:hypothetical protein